MTDEQTTFFCMVFLLMTPLEGCCGIDWNVRRMKFAENPEECDILILNSKSYSFLKIWLPRIQAQILNLLFNILSSIFNVPFLSLVFHFIRQF